MKILRVVFSLMFMLLFVASPAVAQEPTGTWQPLFPTGTTVPPQNYECPEETPLAYGTVTPGAEWLLNCGSCLPGSVPTHDFGMPTMPSFGTPGIPTDVPGTATPTFSAGSFTFWRIPTCNYGCGLGTLPYMWYRDTEGYLDIHSMNSGVNWIDVKPTQYCGISRCEPNNGGSRDNWYEVDCAASWNYAMYTDTTAYFRWYNGGGDIVGEVTVVSCGTGTSGGCAINLEGKINANQSLYGEFWYQFYVTRAGLPGSRVSASYAMCHVKQDITQLPVDNPTPTPTANSYCNTIQDDTGGEDGFQLPTPMVGSLSCTGIPAFTIPAMGEITPEVVFPGLQICFAPIEFGDMEIVGITINLDIIAFAMAGVALLRIILRS